MRKIVALLLCCVVALAFTACAKDKENEKSEKVVLKAEKDVEYPVEVGDSEVKDKPDTIVSLSPALTEVLYDLGYEDNLEGVSEFCNYPEEATELKNLGNAKTIDLDAIKDIRPDVVFTSTKLADLDVMKLGEMGATVAYLPPVEDFDDIFDFYDQICMIMEGKVTGKENAQNKYGDLKDKLTACQESIADYLSGGEQKVSASYVAVPKYTVATGDSFIGDAMKRMNLVNVAEDYENWVFPEGETFAPQLLIYSQDLPKETLRQYYSATPAVTNGFLYTLNPEGFERQGFRMLEELIEIAKYAYSDADFEEAEQDSNAETPETNPEPSTEDSAA